MKKNKSVILLIVVFLLGLGLLLYPSISNYWNSFHQTRAISSYTEKLNALSEEDYEEILRKAQDFNAKISKLGVSFVLSEQEKEEYYSLLNIDSSGVMGTIEIDKIHVTLPIYHGTSDEVLQAGVGHIEGTSLPVGGESTHCVLSGHRGLPTSKLFTRLDELTEGDTFRITTLYETLTYEVDQILIVEPDDVSALGIVEGEDLCTLITCTPYGINTHRLLVRGHRVDGNAAYVEADAIQIETNLTASVIAVPILIALFIALLIRNKNRKKGPVYDDED